ncbi:MAG: hypothetical protein IKN39_00565 [Clostridia bacterium]|nr:hypothetical protein [Clostridia bacterium]
MLIKIIGVTAVIISFSSLGFFKSYSKKTYIIRLKKIYEAFLSAGNLLRLGADSREKILSSAFMEIEGFKFSAGGVTFSDKCAKDALISSINTFLSEFGSGDYQTEQKRIERACYTVKKELEAQKEEYEKSHKIWQTLGVCAGLSIGIILI